MADLFDRLLPAAPDTENIAVHYFFAALVDHAAGAKTLELVEALAEGGWAEEK